MNLNKKLVSMAYEHTQEYSIEDLFLTYKTPIYQFIYRYCQDEQLYIDVVQDTFVKFHKYQHKFDGKKSSIKTYLFRIAYQILINRLKRRRRMKKILPFLYHQHEKSGLTQEETLTIREAIQQLPYEQRAVIILTYYHDLTQKDISAILDIPVGTIKSRLHAALKKLKNILEVSE